MKTAITSLFGLGIFLVSGLAAAQQQYGGGYSGSYQPAPMARSKGVDNIGEEAQITFGVDRVMGLAFDQTKIEPSGGSITNKSTTVALFGNPSAGAQGPSMMMPRLALDYFVVESISVGGSLVYITSSGKTELDPDPAGASGDTGTRSLFAIAPRVGYAMAFDETFSLWPRAGITWFSYTEESPAATGGGNDKNTLTGFDLTVEAMVGISPIENFAILAGPYVDLGLSGNAKSEPSGGGSTEADAKTTSYGLTVGILGYY